ncbi:helicase-related protein [Bacillus sp. T33-2]|uniref:helicase-related protein n=1 Tax=Bacillus sp. T33-2 TaxID=2054168 RepID=UPI000C77B44C|nr:helicase-related protein [Bacillus sp. T33-2]PLR91131.1 RNA helicase [Bacillus sp. T33-2]
MNQLLTVYPKAVEQTKQKIFGDIDLYLGKHKSMPSFDEYLSERRHYIEQIWMNVWLNKSTNDVPKIQKKAFLNAKGFVTEAVDRKLINTLFRNQMRTYQPFDAIAWVIETFSHKQEEWKERYKNARTDFLIKEKALKLQEKRMEVRKAIQRVAEDYLGRNYGHHYLHVRHFTAKQLVQDLDNNPKYGEVDTFALEEKLINEGRFNAEDYFSLSEFLNELTGDIHKTVHWGRSYYEYETYYFRYERLITSHFYEIASSGLFEDLTSELLEEYHQTHMEPLDTKVLKKLMAESLSAIFDHYLSMLEEEHILDLIELAAIPFDADVHRSIYEQDLAARERRKAQKVAEVERKQAEEKRILDDIFGQEYSPAIGQNIRYVLHIGETNTGKTHHALTRMKDADSGLYLAPLRLLALEVYDRLNSEGVVCSLKTGEEEKLNDGAQHYSCTVEMFHEKDFFEVVVIDEAQMIADKDRGFSWYKAITKANAREVHIIGSMNIKTMMLELLGDSEVEVHEYSREIPLQIERKEFNLNQTKKGDALVCFSRRQVLETASRLQNNGHTASMIYGSMPPETRKKQIQRFIDGQADVIVATDAIGMGLNLPIRRIALLENEKFDGTRRRRLTSQEVKQIAGRAGRKGIYDVGKVAFSSDIKLMKKLLQQEDAPVLSFAIAPTSTVFERFQKYYRSLGTFFELWEQFDSPQGTNKATLSEERELYELIRGSEIERRMSMMDLYGFLHLPFSKKEPVLTQQWLETMTAIVSGSELPEPVIKTGNLEELELSYKALGLHLLFLYRLDKRTEAVYWERVREGLSDEVHEYLKSEVRHCTKKCRHCGKKLPADSPFQICNDCHSWRYKKRKHTHRR